MNQLYDTKIEKALEDKIFFFFVLSFCYLIVFLKMCVLTFPDQRPQENLREK